MAVNGIEIKAGQKWRTADDRVVEINGVSRGAGLCVSGVDENGGAITLTSDGRYSIHGASALDLVALIDGGVADDHQKGGVGMDVPGYEKLASVLQAAYNQAVIGKGKERHANDKPFHEQPMCAISRNLGSIDGLLYQATKKPQEARGLPTRARALAEIYGAINYLAGAAILIEEGIIKGQE